LQAIKLRANEKERMERVRIFAFIRFYLLNKWKSIAMMAFAGSKLQIKISCCQC